MTTPINQLGGGRPLAGTPGSSTETKSKAAGGISSPANNSTDKVSLSEESQQVSSLQQQLNNSPAIDQAKVDSIKQEIANGNYPLDAEKIANNLFNLEQSLLE